MPQGATPCAYGVRVPASGVPYVPRIIWPPGDDPRFDFLVTSTLASQGPQAVGRALAIEHLLPAAAAVPPGDWPRDAISFVSCGDGSINNSEWLASINAAELMARALALTLALTTPWP